METIHLQLLSLAVPILLHGFLGEYCDDVVGLGNVFSSSCGTSRPFASYGNSVLSLVLNAIKELVPASHT